MKINLDCLDPDELEDLDFIREVKIGKTQKDPNEERESVKRRKQEREILRLEKESRLNPKEPRLNSKEEADDCFSQPKRTS